jgi:hypothetical protein
MKLQIADQCLVGFVVKFAPEFFCNGIDRPEPRVVPGAFILFSWISQTCNYHN